VDVRAPRVMAVVEDEWMLRRNGTKKIDRALDEQYWVLTMMIVSKEVEEQMVLMQKYGEMGA
jgi:hypothetical protein